MTYGRIVTLQKLKSHPSIVFILNCVVMREVKLQFTTGISLINYIKLEKCVGRNDGDALGPCEAGREVCEYAKPNKSPSCRAGIEPLQRWARAGLIKKYACCSLRPSSRTVSTNVVLCIRRNSFIQRVRCYNTSIINEFSSYN